MSRATSRRAVLQVAGLAGAAALLGGLTGCSPRRSGAASPAGASTSPTATATARPAAKVTLTTREGSGDGAVVGAVPHLVATVTGGDLAHVVVRAADGTSVSGATAAGDGGHHTWTPSAALVPGAAYTATASSTGTGAKAVDATLAFTVAPADQQVSAKMMPLDGETVGVGMPVVLILSSAVAVADRAKLTGAATVDSGGVVGAWRWISASEVHWRPQQYWPAGTKVRVQVPLAGVQLGERYGSADRDVSFTVGDAHISVADTVTHQMTTSVNGQAVKTIPISAGREDSDPHFVTRSGPHLVSEKYATYFMDGATVGLDYAETVQWATRIANSGEFVHAAPWSVAQQGHANVSHGCLNASPADAHWFYDLARRGDVVEVTGTDRPLELTNGLGDWTLSWEQWTAPQT